MLRYRECGGCCTVSARLGREKELFLLLGRFEADGGGAFDERVVTFVALADVQVNGKGGSIGMKERNSKGCERRV